MSAAVIHPGEIDAALPIDAQRGQTRRAIALAIVASGHNSDGAKGFTMIV